METLPGLPHRIILRIIVLNHQRLTEEKEHFGRAQRETQCSFSQFEKSEGTASP